MIIFITVSNLYHFRCIEGAHDHAIACALSTRADARSPHNPLGLSAPLLRFIP